MEIINAPGYDPDSVREAQRQLNPYESRFTKISYSIMKNVFQTI